MAQTDLIVGFEKASRTGDDARVQRADEALTADERTRTTVESG